MDTNTKIELLIKEAETNPASNDVFHVMAARKRARNSINLSSLTNKMRKEGFDYAKKDYLPSIKLLAQLGFGELDLDKRGKIIGLKNIKVTLQSVGAAACRQGNHFSGFVPRNKFGTLVPKPEVVKPVPQDKKVETDKGTLSLPVGINNKIVMIKVSRNISGEDMATLIDKLYA